MVSMASLAKELTVGLELDQPPVQISYLDQPPTGVVEHPGGAPSVCTLFAEGEKRTFFAPTHAHEDCEVGAFVMGIPPAGAVGDRLTKTLQMMHGAGYLSPGEEAKIPHNAQAPKFVAYGPLGTLPVPPTNVLIFARPRSAMLALEAAHFEAPMNGRPMCSIVPVLNGGAKVAFSMGCIGSRIYTQMGDDRMVIGIRGDYLATFVRDLRSIRRANDLVGAEDAQRKAKAEAARRRR
jgi:uncharacterized protein (DUF169 family)